MDLRPATDVGSGSDSRSGPERQPLVDSDVVLDVTFLSMVLPAPISEPWPILVPSLMIVGLSSERGIAWRVAESLRAFLDLDVTEAPPNHSAVAHAASETWKRTWRFSRGCWNGWRERVWQFPSSVGLVRVRPKGGTKYASAVPPAGRPLRFSTSWSPLQKPDVLPRAILGCHQDRGSCTWSDYRRRHVPGGASMRFASRLFRTRGA